ncbi:MAG TPA: hypothetical protein VFL64_10765 [Rhizobacter sp.]|nr:hypothetical protein [Rhizobacter sp.]
MAKLSNQQPSLKPQDLYVLLALLARRGQAASYPELAELTGLASSAVHAALRRAAVSGLAMFQERRPVVLKPQLKEFLLHGARYAFPPLRGAMARGVPTAYAAQPLAGVIAPSADPVPVWPHARGTVRGQSLVPLYPSVPAAALRNPELYALLALFDALRSGQARERNAAERLLEGYFE